MNIPPYFHSLLKKTGIRSGKLAMVAGVAILVILWTIPSLAQTPIQISFNTDDIGKFPPGWQGRDKTNMAKVYSVQAEEGSQYLHADSFSQGVQIGYEKGWDLKDLPILRWRWRALVFPEGSHEQEKSRNDSALGVYVVFKLFPLRVIKYIWSDTLIAGSSFNSPNANGVKIVVVRSGRGEMGFWVDEERNVLEDYRRFFGEREKNPAAKGIAILTDADDTRSHAVGDYAYIQVLSTGEEQVSSKKRDLSMWRKS